MATAPRVQAGRPQGREAFFLAWCYERCNKADQAQTLAELQAIAGSFGMTLVLHKKSKGFLHWLEGTRGNVLVLADWREAKPILDGHSRLEEDGQLAELRGLQMCVLAQSDKMYRRASEWAVLIRQGGGMEIGVLHGYSREGVEAFIMQSLEAGSPTNVWEGCGGSPSPTSHIRDGAASSSHSLEATGSTAPRLSLATLMEALQNPEEASRLEEMIQGSMWQTYEE